MRARPVTRVLALTAVVTATLAGCSLGPSDRPGFAFQERSVGSPGADTSPTVEPPPAPEVPIVDLSYVDCTSMLITQWSLPAPPAGVTLECSSYQAPMDPTDPALPTEVSVGVVRATSAATPADAAPVIYTSGADRPSSAAVAELATQPNNPLLAEHPVVAIDRRGTGLSFPLLCANPLDQQTMITLGQFAGGDPVDAVAAAARDITVDCRDAVMQSAEDFRPPGRMVFRASDAAADIEVLRDFWGVSTIGLIGAGNGALTALAYAAAHPDHVGRLILDAPVSTGPDPVQTTEFRVIGQQAALDSFVARCRAIACSLGDDPAAAIDDLVARAAGGGLPPLSRAGVIGALQWGLSDVAGADSGARTRILADALSAARDGNVDDVLVLSDRNLAATGSDGQLASRCSDGNDSVAPDRVRELAAQWSDQYPVFGPTAALGMLACTAWPADEPPTLPAELSVPVLVTNGISDPVTGNTGTADVTGSLANAGAATSTLTWHGLGHPPLSGSGCIAGAVTTYIDSGRLPADGTVCPP
ncbi:alpha/beta fold hydrolase [Millisia brevis]|uniref:alpha/beta fold hydrolase n=1 Tax=Millisia brevis TaxID=264148 RepID=UPI000A8F62B9|nr:alpha/beta fold hydrolase [Millisia brevis]